MNTNLSVVTHPLKRQYLAEGNAVPSKFIDKNVNKLSIENNIIQRKIRHLEKEGRRFKVCKCSDVLSAKAESMKAKTELGLSDASNISLHTEDRSCERFSNGYALLYRSKGKKQSLSCEFYRNNELVTCRHLSHWWLAKDKFKYVGIASGKLIEECSDLRSSSMMEKEFYENGCPSEGIYFEINKFHETIYNVATTLAKGQEKRYLLDTYNHSMGLCIKKNRDNNIIIYYYDPNDTLRHRKIIAETENCLISLRCNDFWSPLHMRLYFTRMDKVGCLLSLDTKALQKDCNVVCMDNPSAEVVFMLCRNGHYGHSAYSSNLESLDKYAQKQLITKKSEHGSPPLYMACQNGHVESTKVLLDVILKSDLSSYTKKELIAGRNYINGVTVLYIACYAGHNEIVGILLEAIVTIDLELSAKKELLAGKRANDIPALYIACAKGYHEVVKVLLETMCSSDLKLNTNEQEELITGGGQHNLPALFAAVQETRCEVVKVYLNAVLRSTLDSPAKERLLAVKTEDGLSALQMAINEEKMDIVNVFVEIVKNSNALCVSEKYRLLEPYNQHITKKWGKNILLLHSSCKSGNIEATNKLLKMTYSFNLDQYVKKELLAGKMAGGTPALYVACQEGYHEVVKVLLDTIYSTNLDKNVNKELLAGKGANDIPALYIACDKGYHEVVKVLLETICSSDLKLNANEQEELIIGEGKHNLPALFAAVQEAHCEVVKVYLNAVLRSRLDTPAKERLLTVKTEDGLSALQMAINEKKMDIVNVFVKIVKNSNALCASEKGRLLEPYKKHKRKNKTCQIL